MIAIGVLIMFATVRLTEGGDSHAGWTWVQAGGEFNDCIIEVEL